MKSHSEWVKESIAQQQNMNNQLGDRIWDEFCLPENKVLLFQKVALPMFGSPKKNTDDFGLDEEEKKLVNDIVDKCIKCGRINSVVDLSVIFVFVRVNDGIHTSAPLFRVRSNENDKLISQNKFIDHLGRVYDDWAHFKKTNKWDKSWLCVPLEGFYAIEKDICYEVWDQSSQGKVLNVIDKASSVAAIVTTTSMIGGTVACLFPPTALIGGAVVIASSIVGAPSAAYGFGRSVEKIIDRATHDQSISLLNSEARHCWLMTATSVLSVGVLASTSGLVLATRASILPSSTIRALATTLNITSLSVSGLCMINSIHQLSQKDEITALDIFHLSTSIFFFTHNLVSFQTASGIIKRTQQEEILNIRNQLSMEDQQKFDAQWKVSIDNFEKGNVRQMHGQAQFIREIKNINNLKEFYENFQINSEGNLFINNELDISAKSFFQMNNEEKNKLIELTKKLSNNQIGMKRFNKSAKPIFSKYDIKLEHHIESNVTILRESFGVENISDIRIGNTNVGKVQPNEVNKLANVLKECFHYAANQIMELVNKIAEKYGINSVGALLALFEHITGWLMEEVKSVKNGISILSNKEMLGKRIKMSNKNCRIDIAEEWCDSPTVQDILNESFTNHQSTQNKVNMESNSELNPMSRENYDNHKYFPLDNEENYLTPDEYFCIAIEIAGDIPSEIIWIQSGSTLECILICKKYGNITIFFDHIENETKITTTIMGVTLKKNIKK